ncbi:hypothetical protein ACROYT_G001715 [Oculina patagonica]
MSNVTAREDNTTRFQGEVLPPGLAVFLVALNIFLSITASLGNALILIALHKVTSIHPPTKLLFRCLAVTDLCVGLIPQPILAIYVMGTMVNVNWNNNYYMCQSSLTSRSISVSAIIKFSYNHTPTKDRRQTEEKIH